MSIIFNIIESKSTVNVVNDFVRITVADGVSVDTVNSLIDDKLTKENIIGLKLADSPEFADELITPLALEATYTPTVWAYLVALFTDVPKSVLQHFVKLWGVVNNLAVRIGLLEDSYLLKYVVPVDTSAIELTTDRYGNTFNFMEGDEISISIDIETYITSISLTFIRLNNVTSSDEYLYTSTTKYPGLLAYVHSYANNSIVLKITNNGILAITDCNYILSDNSSWGRYNVSSFTKPVTRNGIIQPPITQLQILFSTIVKAGSIIIIKKR